MLDSPRTVFLIPLKFAEFSLNPFTLRFSYILFYKEYYTCNCKLSLLIITKIAM